MRSLNCVVATIPVPAAARHCRDHHRPASPRRQPDRTERNLIAAVAACTAASTSRHGTQTRRDLHIYSSGHGHPQEPIPNHLEPISRPS
ncbi:hypothetical protein I553_9248 [Mycobacterium xenopi 4042]|uniref:Uncharacterized protein n=1 Tax=Mycobacterium xenopi 4042 TaxID=1299334 RepID=X8A9X2_MYCXE|nr:hypothetical protein I553_9248 [Mycobacterium xenopi 4042]